VSFDSFLNSVIPAAIILLVVGFIYFKAKDPIDSFFVMVKGWFTPKEDDGGGQSNQPAIGNYSIEYVGG
jgi:hypothetical protein